MMSSLYVKKRSGGRFVSFDISKIAAAIYKAMCDTKKGDKDLAMQLAQKVKFDSKSVIDIEEIQDQVENILMKEMPDVAKAYILYREKKKKFRKELASTLNVKVEELDDNSKKNLTINSAGVFAGRYLLRDLKSGDIIETMPELFDRISKHIALMDIMYSNHIYDKNERYDHTQEDYSEIESMYSEYKEEDKNTRLNSIYLQHFLRVYDRLKSKIIFSAKEFFFCMFTNLDSDRVKKQVQFHKLNLDELVDLQEELIEEFETRVSVYKKLISSFRFLPNTPTIMNAGTKNGQLCACFTLDIDDSLRSIMKTVSETAFIFQGAGGVGINFSKIRPAGDFVDNVPRAATGPISFQSMINFNTDIIKQGGKRKGANMGLLNSNHPDIEQWITMKTIPKVMENYNISIGIDKMFWNYYDVNEDYPLVNPRDNSIVKKIPSHQLFSMIADSAWKCAEPGVIYFDNVNKHNPLRRLLGDIKITNPCITGDTRLATSKGLIRMEDLYIKGRHLEVITDNRTTEDKTKLGITIRNAIPVFKTSDSEDVWKIETEHGYEIKATNYHDFFVNGKKIKLKDLKIGDKLWIQSDEGEFGNQGSREIGMILGALESDGHLNESRKQLILQFNGEKRKESKQLLDMINSVIPQTKSTNNIHDVNICEVKSRDMQLIQSSRMYEWVKQFNYQKGVVPEVIWQGSRECVIAYLQALFGFDGTVMRNKKSCDVRLTQSNYEFLQQIQLLLSNFGIICKIYLRRKACEQLMPDGKGGQKLYQRKNSYEIIITGKNRNRFMEKIRFLSDIKNEKVDDFIRKTQSYDRINYETKIKSITYIGKEVVYDTTVPNNNSIIVSGIVTGQCAEQAMYPNNSCTLGSINLAKYVHDGEFDYDEFKEDVYTATQFLDSVIDINNYPTEEIERESLKIRRIGLGYMGLAHALYKMKIPYNSERGFEFIQKISELLTFHTIEMSIQLAEQRGAHGYWDYLSYNIKDNLALLELVFDSYTESRLSSYVGDKYYPILESIKKHGVRHTWTTTIAPTGTISMAADTSNGVEPIYALVYVKQTSVGKFYYVDKEFERTLKEEGLYSDELLEKIAANHGSCRGLVPDELADIFVTAVDIHWIDHIFALAMAQKGISNSISKTINLAKYVTPDDIKLAYLLSHNLGIKGLSIYRDGSRESQVLDTTSMTKVKENEYKNPFNGHLTTIGEKGVEKTAVIETKPSKIAMYIITNYVIPQMSVDTRSFVKSVLVNNNVVGNSKLNVNTDKICPLCAASMIDNGKCISCSVCQYGYCA